MRTETQTQTVQLAHDFTRKELELVDNALRALAETYRGIEPDTFRTLQNARTPFVKALTRLHLIEEGALRRNDLTENMTLWAAREEDGDLRVFRAHPTHAGHNGDPDYKFWDDGSDDSHNPEDILPNLTFGNSPARVEMAVRYRGAGE